MNTYMTAGPSYLPSYHIPLPQHQPYHNRPQDHGESWGSSQQPTPQHPIPIAHPRPMRTFSYGAALCKHLEQMAAKEVELEEARRRARQAELPSLRALRESLPETEARRPRPAQRGRPPSPPPQVFYAPGDEARGARHDRRRASPIPESVAVPAPEVGWTVRLVAPKAAGAARDDLPFGGQGVDGDWTTASSKSAGKRRAVSPCPQEPTEQPKAAPRGPRPYVVHKRGFSDNYVASFVPAQPVHERRNTVSEAPPVPPKGGDSRYLAVPQQNHPPTPPPKSPVEETTFTCFLCGRESVGVPAHQRHIRVHGLRAKPPAAHH